MNRENPLAMHTIRFDGREVPCPDGANLRVVLLRARLPLYNGAALAVNCRGSGTCGTCAVRIEGTVSEPTRIEKLRFRLPPHNREKGLRLACQCAVHGDLVVTKYAGMFGQRDQPVSATE